MTSGADLRRGVLTAVAVGGLLAVVGATARARLFREGEPPLSLAASRVVLDAGAYLFLAGLLACLGVIAWALWPEDGYEGPQVRPRRPWHAPLQVLGLLAGVAMLIAAVQLRRQAGGAGAVDGRGGTVTGAGSAPSLHTSLAPAFDWPAAAVAATVVLAVALLAWRWVGRARAQARARRELARAVAEVAEDTLEDLRRDGDPRRAVIMAFARLERALAAHGHARLPPETAAEYVQRALLEARLLPAEALARLLSLFHEARFSRHAVTEGMRAEALQCLDRVRLELHAAPAAVEAGRGA